MTQQELEKLKTAAEHIKAQRYKQALSILKTMPNNAKAQEWIIKVNEKMMFDDKPRPAQETSISAPKNAKKSTNKFVRLVLLLVLGAVVLFAITGVGYKVLVENPAYDAYLPRAQFVLGAFCLEVWSDSYTTHDCATYSVVYLAQDRNLLFKVQTCEPWWNNGNIGMFITCLDDIKVPVEILDY